jgi:glycosyltransferase involved in cell wall biosynthesis
MHVLHFCPSIDTRYGGPSRTVVSLCNYLSLNDIEVTLLSNFRNSIPINENVKVLNFNSPSKIFTVISFYKMFVGLFNNISLVHIHGIWNIYHIFIALYCILKKKNFVIHPRGMLEPWPLKQKFFKKKISLILYQNFILQRASRIIATSEMEKHNLSNILSIPKKIAVVHNGCYLGEEAIPEVNRDGIVPQKFLFLSRLHEKKGIEILIESFKIITKIFPHTSLTIAGNGEKKYTNFLKSLIKGYEGKIFFIGEVADENKLNLYLKHHIFVLPTYSENFGIVVLEALSCSMPVITTNATPWKIIEELKCGWITEPDIDLLTGALLESCNLSSFNYCQMSKNSSFVSKKYTWPAIALSTIKIYSEME